jgi:hypothetical protein
LESFAANKPGGSIGSLVIAIIILLKPAEEVNRIAISKGHGLCFYWRDPVVLYMIIITPDIGCIINEKSASGPVRLDPDRNP